MQEPDREKLEKAINGGQLEEVVQQAENELSLARKMLDWKPWEPLVQEPPQGQWKWPMMREGAKKAVKDSERVVYQAKDA
ncbi:NADH dehydrogenase [ubiquinone] 1 alpha subcomplex subunit 5 [Chionoecetes opilio]|uniref:NADH dehydrogenase [ubiquinone] 1 alpha subcomplex subunit 5 n=1 Tax=Chionoecetes opilio TaxID=41210 RepID=A0A8J5CGG2_CHIOP|nr:NADH dehydrogenase [ubiquinone] 1 alpha subcomplex subunit 5 [Chionoecetes opilio]